MNLEFSCGSLVDKTQPNTILLPLAALLLIGGPTSGRMVRPLIRPPGAPSRRIQDYAALASPHHEPTDSLRKKTLSEILASHARGSRTAIQFRPIRAETDSGAKGALVGASATAWRQSLR